MSPQTELQESSGEKLAAARQVVDLFASEALLALDRYEQSFRAVDAPRQQAAGRLKDLWDELDMDAARVDPQGTDAEQILAAAADLARDPENQTGLSLKAASARARDRAAMEGRTPPSTKIRGLRKAFDDAYDGRVDLPAEPGDWLEQSLTRLARASVLRDVVAEGAQVKASEPLQQAAETMIRQGQQLMDDRQDLARRLKNEQEGIKEQGAYIVAFMAYTVAVPGQIETPDWAHLLVEAPAFAAFAWATIDNLKAHNRAENRLDPAQAQLRSVRSDLIGNLDTSPPGRRDTGASRSAANRRTGPGR